MCFRCIFCDTEICHLLTLREDCNSGPGLKESIRKRIFGPVHIHLDVAVRVTNQIPTIYPIISTQSSIENYAKMRLESRRLPPYLFTCDVTHSLSVESHLQAIVLHFILSIKFADRKK